MCERWTAHFKYKKEKKENVFNRDNVEPVKVTTYTAHRNMNY